MHSEVQNGTKRTGGRESGSVLGGFNNMQQTTIALVFMHGPGSTHP